MAVTKRTRYEVMRRDNFTCRYCRSAENELTVDHVVPVALGGTDKPDNLVAACKACNSGKSSSSPDGTIVDDIADRAILWAKAIQRYNEIQLADRKKRDAYVRRFDKQWRTWRWGDAGKEFPRPSGWKQSIWQFYAAGLPVDELLDAVDIALSNDRVHVDSSWKYLCGVVWRKVEAMQEGASALVQAGEIDGA